MRFACWITKATDTHSEYVILISFFLEQEWLRKALQYYVIRAHAQEYEIYYVDGLGT